MKKLFSFLLLLAVLWLGATWYIGKQADPQMQRYFQDVNSRFAAQMGLQYHLKPVQKGFFTSTYDLEVNATLPIYAKVLQSFPPELRRVRLNVEHGPLFFLHGLGFGLARITSAQPFKTYEKILEPAGLTLQPETGAVHTRATVSFARQLHFEARGDGFVLINKEDNLSTHIAPVTLVADIDPWTYVGHYRMSTPSIEVTAPRAKTPAFQMKDLRLAGHIDAMLQGTLFLGDMTVDAAHMLIRPPKEDAIDLAPRFEFALRSEGNGTVGLDYNGAVRVLSGALPGLATSIVSAEEKLHLGGLSQKGLESFYSKIRRLQSDQIHLYNAMMTQQNTPEVMAKSLVKLQALQKKMQTAMILSLGEMLLPKRSTLSLHLAVGTHTNPDNHVDAKLHFIGTLPKGDARAIQRTLLTQAPELFTLDAQTRFGKTFLQEFGPQGIKLNAMLALAMKQGFISEEQEAFASSLHYTPQSLIINKKPMPQLLLMLKMMSGRGLK